MKRCDLCGLEAQFVVKGSSEYYCRECGEMQFGSLSLLVPLREGLKTKLKVS
ncbi:MAG: hypothetical protein V1831_02340 [Candidatus Woesearchaeota archaeon]